MDPYCDFGAIHKALVSTDPWPQQLEKDRPCGCLAQLRGPGLLLPAVSPGSLLQGTPANEWIKHGLGVR